MAPLLIKEGVLISLQSCSACVLLAGNAQPLPTTQQSSHTKKRMHHDHGLALAKECASMKVLEFGPHCDCIAANQRKSTRSKDGRREEKEASMVLTNVKKETA